MIEELDIPEYDEDAPDDALEEIAHLAPDLTPQERKYVYWRSVALPPARAFQKAGYVGSVWRTVETRPRIRRALEDLNEQLEPQYRVTQQKVIGILMEAVELAKLKEQPKALIEAAVALANVSGVMAATKIQIDQRTLHLEERPQVKALEHMPRRGLERLVGVERLLPLQVVDADFEEVSVESVSL